MTTPNKTHQLIAQFELNLDAYKRGNYNETQVRLEFIDPFFKELGWDVHNELGYAEAFKDVIHEDAIKVGGATKAPDYCFRIGGTRKFFLEAKKPSINIKDDVHPAYQLRRYAWSAKLPLSILTDFEEFAVYECRKRPAKTDKASTDRILYLTFREYAERWEELFAIFSKEAVLKGHFDRFVEKGAKRPTSEVDREFLKEIESWRELLAKNIALRNPQLGVRELNYAVQLTIDRIIFLRICEDRGIETYGQLQALCGGPRIYPRLLEIFYRADDKYNSGLFHFREEKGRHSHSDALTPALLLDDKVLKTILSRLYYPECPYEFSVMPAEILGNVYEQFLGKVIRLTAGHQAKIEEKPEVRKAGGVYYTPKYIVDYIVKQTVGKLCEGKTPRQIEKLRILDPACGSGSFLLGAFQYLLDYHRDYYETEIRESGFQKRHQQQIYQGRGGGWLLTTAEKKRILLNNIYGVDIDEQAVEVTKLSLLLKVLENENQDTLERQLTLWRERALPDLGENIKCGNSLIGRDFYQGQQMNLFDPEEQRRINAFDWEDEFPHIFPPSKGGRGDVGFDAVIGNPPYGAWFKDVESTYFDGHYEVVKGVKDVYACFIEKGTKLLSSNGKLSFIVPSAWTGGPSYRPLRNYVLQMNFDILLMLPYDVFANAYIDTCIFVLTNKTFEAKNMVKTFVFGKREKLTTLEIDDQRYKMVSQKDWHLIEGKKIVLDPDAIMLLQKLQSKCENQIKDIASMKRGVLFDKSLLSNQRLSETYFKYFEGDVYRYQINIITNNWVEFGDKMKERPKEFKWFEGERILLRRLVNRRQRLMAGLTSETFITNKNLYTLLVEDSKIVIQVLLSILNSKLISFLYLKQVSQATKDDFPQVTIKDILTLPFPAVEIVLNRTPQLVSLVNQMLDLHKRLQYAALPQEKTHLQRQISVADRQIDQLVYELYNLTPEEIHIVEDAIK